MQNIIRTFAIVLVLTGAAASTQTSSASSKATIVSKSSAAPTPMCPPNDPNGCNLRGGW